MKNLALYMIIGISVPLLLSGCCFWDRPPPGIPPEADEDIVKIPENVKEFNRTSGAEHMITSLLIGALPHLEHKTNKPTFRLIMRSSDSNDDSLTMKVWGVLVDKKHIIPMTGNNSFKADFVLKSKTVRPGRSNQKAWEIQILSADGKTVHWKNVILFR
jgi:hypothetical protein